jgi:hypothetical protein
MVNWLRAFHPRTVRLERPETYVHARLEEVWYQVLGTLDFYGRFPNIMLNIGQREESFLRRTRILPQTASV